MEQAAGVGSDSSSWGGLTAALVIQGLEFRLAGLDRTQVARLSQRFPDHIRSSDGSAQVSAYLQCRSGAFLRAASEFLSPSREYEPRVAHRADSFQVQGYNFGLEARFVGGALEGELSTIDAASAVEVDVLDNVLRVTSAYAAFAECGLLMHSAGVVLDGGAWLMLGRSNAGKSTLAGAALAAGRPILSDDINLLRPYGAGGFVSGAVPLTGDLRAHQISGPDARFPVRGLLWLSQAETLGIEPMSPGEATARLLACCPVVNTDPYRLDRVLSVIERVLSVLPMHTLRFRRDDPFEEIEALVLASVKPASV